MAKRDNNIISRRIMGSYLSTLISISLVLLLVGVVSLLLVNAEGISDYFKENVRVSVMLKQNVSESSAIDLQKVIDKERFVKESEFISAERGAQEMKALLGEDFLSVFETSPIPISIELTLHADYVSSDSLAMVQAELMDFPPVDEISYQASLVDALNANLSRISAVLGIFIVLMLFISYVLINNTVRLSVYDKRFSIHTMKLVGATRSFIRAPFLAQSAFQGVLSALMSICMLLAILFAIKSGFEQLFTVFSMKYLLWTMGIVLVFGLAICLASTWFVVGKLLSLNKDELY